MLEHSFDLIIGLHSIQAALDNSHRNYQKLYATKEALKDLKNLPSDNKIEMLANHDVQEKGKEYARKLGYQVNRIPSNVFLIADPLIIHEQNLINDKFNKLLCLDSVSDIHNAAAIMRTADFFGVDAIVIPKKKSFGLSPAFYRLSSGAAESLPIIRVAQLSKLVRKLKDQNWEVVGLSEHAKEEFKKPINKKAALIVGAEDVGLSNVVLRECDQVMSLSSQGTIQSLNVSVAAAIALEKCFGR